MKGKTNDPLNLVVDIELYEVPEVQELIQQGHDVRPYNFLEYGRVDGILGARMWRMTPELIKYLPMAIKAVRKAKRDAGKPRGLKVKKARKPKKEVDRENSVSSDSSPVLEHDPQ